MIVTELNYSTDLDRGVVMQPLKNAFLSGDQEAHRFVVDCYRGNSRESVPLTGAVVNAYFIRADSGTVAINGSVANGEAVVELPAACYAVVGRFSLVIKASLGDVIHTILWVEGAVSRSHTGTVIDPGEVVPTLDELLAKISTMEQATAAAQNVVSQYNSKVAEQDEKISQLSEEIEDNCAKLAPGKNKFDKNNVRTGYVDYSNGNVGGVSSYCYYLIACQPGETYAISQTYADGVPYQLHIAFFDDVFDAAHYLSGVLSRKAFVTPENCTIVSVSVKTADVDSLQVEKSPVKTLYQPYEKKVQYEELGTAVKERIRKKVVHVGVDGNTEYEYDSILEALIANPTDTIIYLHSGVYDVVWMYQRYYGSDYFEKYAGYAGTGDPMDAGLFLGDGVEIIGVGNVRVEFIYTGDNEAVKQRFSVFSTTQNNVIDNITIYTSNNQCCRYHIHDDYSETLEGGGTNHFRNIVFDGYTALGTCVGGGMGKKNTYIIEDCLFMNLGQAIAISYHNCIDDAVNKLIVKNNYCDGSIRILHYGVSGANTSKALITNNYCTMVRVLFTDETNYPNANIQVFEWGNEKTQQ